ncbi:MAG: hypothetical protein K2W82_10200 [Candidatus Obscuribacterales bacterium]|nr:hypothetical protein [Candidatus Obscuribacterales bacterium]
MSMVKIRNCRGQGIIEGTVGLIMVITGIVMGVVLLLCTGFAVNYKQKLGFVAQEVSAYVQGRGDWLGTTRPDYSPSAVQTEAAAVANELLEQFGLPPYSNIRFDESRVGNHRYCKVTLTINQLQIPGAGILPSMISMSETGAAVDHSSDCWGYAQIRINGQMGNAGIVVPIVGYTLRNQPFNMGGPYGCTPRGASYTAGYMLQGEPVTGIRQLTANGIKEVAF